MRFEANLYKLKITAELTEYIVNWIVVIIILINDYAKDHRGVGFVACLVVIARDPGSPGSLVIA